MSTNKIKEKDDEKTYLLVALIIGILVIAGFAIWSDIKEEEKVNTFCQSEGYAGVFYFHSFSQTVKCFDYENDTLKVTQVKAVRFKGDYFKLEETKQ